MREIEKLTDVILTANIKYEDGLNIWIMEASDGFIRKIGIRCSPNTSWKNFRQSFTSWINAELQRLDESRNAERTDLGSPKDAFIPTVRRFMHEGVDIKMDSSAMSSLVPDRGFFQIELGIRQVVSAHRVPPPPCNIL